MDVLYQLGGLDFVWTVSKAADNIEKHEIRFERACEVFFDPLVQVVDATADDEAREALIGETYEGALLFVVNVEREGEAIRIISARPASPAERNDYEDNA